MNLSWLFFAVAFLVGALITVRTGSNARLKDAFGSHGPRCRPFPVRRRGAAGASAWGSDAHVAGRHRSAHLLGRTRSFRLGGLHRTRGGHGAARGLFADARVLLDRAPLKRARYSTRWANSSPSFEGGWRVGGSARPSAG